MKLEGTEDDSVPLSSNFEDDFSVEKRTAVKSTPEAT
jgi:hypothetical protein